MLWDESTSHSHERQRELRIALLLEHRHGILSRIRWLTRNEQDALDLVQDVCIAVLTTAMHFEDETHFARWCSGVVQRIALQSYRHTRRRTRLEAELGGVCRGSGFEALADPEARVARQQLVDRSVSAVDIESLELLLARYVERATATELAQQSSQSPAALRMRLSRIRATLRRALS
jgi:RNA polymerase sigma factor (sigma-70 family)